MSSKIDTNKKASDYDKIAVSWHEAAHSIVAILHMMNVVSVKIIMDGNESGKTEWIHGFDYNQISILDQSLLKLIVINDIEILYAGLIAEKIYYKDICGSDSFPRILRQGSEDDISRAAILINKFNLAPAGKSRFTFKKKLEANIKQFLTDNWEDVKVVAHVLYKKKNLNGEELKNILTKKTKNKSFWKEKYKHIELVYSKETIKEDELKIILSK